MNLGIVITAVVMLLIMCSPIFIFRNKNKNGKSEKKDETKE